MSTESESPSSHCFGDASERRAMCQVLHYWLERHVDGALPPAESFDESDLQPELAATLFLIGLPDENDRWIIRRCGSRLAELCTEDPLGRSIQEVLPGELRDRTPYMCKNVLQFRRPLASGGSLVHMRGELLYRKMLMPLGGPDGSVGAILGSLTHRPI